MTPTQLHVLQEFFAFMLCGAILVIPTHFWLIKKSQRYARILARQEQSFTTLISALAAIGFVFGLCGTPAVAVMHLQHELSHGADGHEHEHGGTHDHGSEPAVVNTQASPPEQPNANGTAPAVPEVSTETSTAVNNGDVHVHEDGIVHSAH